MSFSNESFLAQTHAQGYGDMFNGYGSFVVVVSDSTQVPAVQAYKAPAANTSLLGFLTPREIEILELLGTGLSVKGAARELAISPGTVKWHVKNIYYKLGASSREDALLKARLRKIIE
ncbi:response regulator transcription factor [Stenotrophobium rhamnosiphilum]|uniref:HTH luxR-type domain-containing protein n=1 Tax=Stenotrophobium rhamnosiphilum TaxID=2029166 RepID=A0A2T5MKL4_9GAMM|nr:LuxR C-terminal-related transcriptional regulator [Stenotrophobium rhamnosiphilum]PTU33099.1 hypothetical protein CJD38_03060 [Stenotrophobium rhamnosiphilum]